MTQRFHRKSRMSDATPRPRRWKRRLKIAVAIFAVVTVALSLWLKDAVRSLASLRCVEGTSAYVMDYYADHNADEFRREGMDVGNIEDSCLKTLLPDILLPMATRIKRQFVPDPIETVSSEGEHCSALFLQSDDGTCWFARNQDYYHDAFLILRIHDADGLQSIALIDLSYLNMNRDDLETTNLIERLPLLFAPYYAFDGVNRHGVAVGIMSVRKADPPSVEGRPSIINTGLMRVILDHARSTEEALQLTNEFNVHFVKEPQHFLIADASGDSRVVEFIDNEIRCTPAADRWQVCTNHTLWDRSEAASDERCDRYRAGSELAAALPEHIDEEETTAAIRSMYVDDWTMWTSVYNLTSGDFSVIYRSRVDQEYRDQIPRLPVPESR